LNSQQAGFLLLEPHPQSTTFLFSILLRNKLVYFSDRVSHFLLGLNQDPPTYASWTYEITGVHHHTTPSFLVENRVLLTFALVVLEPCSPPVHLSNSWDCSHEPPLLALFQTF
jgi:hypothetical protein